MFQTCWIRQQLWKMTNASYFKTIQWKSLTNSNISLTSILLLYILFPSRASYLSIIVSILSVSYCTRTTKLLGVILVSLGPSVLPSVCPSVRLSVCSSRIPCPLCRAYSSGWIHFILIHLIKQLQKVCCMWSFFQKLQNLNFWQFLKICNFDLVLFWLGIWCESLVWVIR